MSNRVSAVQLLAELPDVKGYRPVHRPDRRNGMKIHPPFAERTLVGPEKTPSSGDWINEH